MLPKANRIIKKEDFGDVYRQSRTVSWDNIVLKYRENSQKNTRIGIVVSTKFSKLAVERNRIKRQLRAVFGSKISLMRPGWDIVVIARKKEKQSAKIKGQELGKMIENALNKAKLIR